MPDKLQSEQKEFMIEKIKERPINKKKLMRRTMITAAMAVIFGLIACFTFLVLEPIISNWLYPEEPPQMVLFPEDSEEKSPEEMLSDTMQDMQSIQSSQSHQNNQNVQIPGEGGDMVLTQEQIQGILSRVVSDKDSYVEIYSALSYYVSELEKSLVIVTGISSEVDWLDNVTESSYQSSGVIIANNGKELLMLTDYKPLEDAEKLIVTFYDSMQIQAYVKQYDDTTDLAVIAISLEGLSKEYIENFVIATLGTSNSIKMEGTPVVALGNPMGVFGSLGYGMITGQGYRLEVDSRYKLLYTDIYGSMNAGGFLFNMHGQLIGVITDYKSMVDMKNMVTAYGISNLRKLVEKLSNQMPVPYLGIKGLDVDEQVHTELKVPFGAYVKSVAKDSPAMLAGILQGDIIVQLDNYAVPNFGGYISLLMQMEAGQTVNVKVLRQVQKEYKEMTFTITLGKSGKGE